MTLLRVYAKMDSNHKIALPRGVRKALEIQPGEKLELTIVGMNKVKKLLVSKVRRYLR
jgi:bifunctional DNA-binding transcriptional regulator/antitoxin component of YhaV-PrlF toxin-antitoxin module